MDLFPIKFSIRGLKGWAFFVLAALGFLANMLLWVVFAAALAYGAKLGWTWG